MSGMAALLLIPFFALRFGLMAWLDKAALARAAAFAPMTAGERPAYWVYQLANAAILIGLFFLDFRKGPLLWIGAALYVLGSVLLAAAVVNFCAPAKTGMNRNGVYRFSRNPMYVAYFMIFLGCAAITASLPLLCLVLCFQVSAHWIIKAEERWCAETFGEEYLAYAQRVRRYF